MTAKILLFGFDSLLSVLALEAAAGPFGAELIPVARADYHKPIGVLAGEDAVSGVIQPYAGMPLGGRMLVLCGLDDRLETLIPALNKAGAGPDCVKAVLTPHNRSWNAVTLFAELQRERRAFQGK